MEPLNIFVLSNKQGLAIIKAVGQRKRGGLPEAVIEIRLMLPTNATDTHALDIALLYLDPA